MRQAPTNRFQSIRDNIRQFGQSGRLCLLAPEPAHVVDDRTGPAGQADDQVQPDHRSGDIGLCLVQVHDRIFRRQADRHQRLADFVSEPRCQLPQAEHSLCLVQFGGLFLLGGDIQRIPGGDQRLADRNRRGRGVAVSRRQMSWPSLCCNRYSATASMSWNGFVVNRS